MSNVMTAMTNLLGKHFPYLLWTYVHMSMQVMFPTPRGSNFICLNKPMTNMRLLLSTSSIPSG